jgi:hypothetical protein
MRRLDSVRTSDRRFPSHLTKVGQTRAVRGFDPMCEQTIPEMDRGGAGRHVDLRPVLAWRGRFDVPTACAHRAERIRTSQLEPKAGHASTSKFYRGSSFRQSELSIPAPQQEAATTNYTQVQNELRNGAWLRSRYAFSRIG